MQHHRSSLVVVLGTLLLWAGTALAAPTAQQKCDGARVEAWRKYVSCVENVVAKDAGGTLSPSSQEEFEAFAKCRHKYFSKWATLQGAAYTGSTCIGTRFTDNGDSTVTDNLSGLTWEKKTDDSSVHDWDNFYTWSTGAPYKENGTAFTSFLDAVNAGGGSGGANGWRLPTLAEMQTIVLDFECTTASCTCLPSYPCVDPALDASTTHADFYWGATTYVPDPDRVWSVYSSNGSVELTAKDISFRVRAVRGGL